MELLVSDKARSDLLRIYRYLEDRSPRAANAFVRKIDASFGTWSWDESDRDWRREFDVWSPVCT